MSRTSQPLWSNSRDAYCFEEVTERFTLRQTLPDGTILRSDGKDFWSDSRRGSWYGKAPMEWDASKAVEEGFVVIYESDVDYS